MANSIQAVLNRTSVDTIAIWIQSSPSVNVDWGKGAIVPFPLPITLSTGVAISKFIVMNQPPLQVTLKTSLNQRTAPFVKQTLGSGTVWLSAQSSAITAINNILKYQRNANRRVSGTMYIFNLSALILDKYYNTIFTSSYVGSSREGVLDEVSFPIEFDAPISEVNLGSVVSGIQQLQGLGISL